MAGRPKKKNGRVVNYYLSEEILEMIEEHRGELSRSQFVEKAIKFYISLLEELKNLEEKNYEVEGNNPVGRGSRARSKARDLGSRPVGVRGFESHPLHSFSNDFIWEIT